MDSNLISKVETKTRIQSLATKQDDTACIIFGAGASFGYSDENYFKPPIVKDLFDDSNNLVKEIINSREHASIKTNRQHYKDQLQNYNNDLEAYLSFLYKRNPKDSLFSNFLIYLQDIYINASKNFTSEPNNYKKLINLMWDLHGDKHWACISFNYDTLLEKSYAEAGRDPVTRKFDSLESYTNHRPVILKMHGGINFRYAHVKSHEYNDDKIKFPVYSLFSKMMSNEDNWKVGLADVVYPELEKPNHHQTYYKGDMRMSYYDFPLMLIPVHATVQTGNPYFENMANLAKTEIEKSNLIISIGYNFGDDSFLGKLSSLNLSKKEIILVGTKSSNIDFGSYLAFQRIKKDCPDTCVKIFDGNGFTEFIKAIR